MTGDCMINTVMHLVSEGWRPCAAVPEATVHARLGCEYVMGAGENRPYWFERDGVACCIGCQRACSLNQSAESVKSAPVQHLAEPFLLTPQEMVRRRHTLNVREAAYCLNVSKRTIWNWVAEGRLVALKVKPVRIRASDVAAMMEDFDE